MLIYTRFIKQNFQAALLTVGFAITISLVPFLTPKRPEGLTGQTYAEVYPSTDNRGHNTQLSIVNFKLRNDGKRTITIKSVHSSCGCSKPTIRPEVILPDQICDIEIEVRHPPVGERAVTVSLNTDSQLTPKVNLELRVFGLKKPPFIFDTTKNLSLTYDKTVKEPSPTEIEIKTIETSKNPQEPTVSSDTSFLKFRPISVDESSYTLPGTILRTYRFAVDVLSTKPIGDITGVITVKAKWSPDEIAEIGYFIKEQSSILVVPQNLNVELTKKMEPKFMVVNHTAYKNRKISFSGTAMRFFNAVPQEKLGEGQYHSYILKPKEQTIPVGAYTLDAQIQDLKDSATISINVLSAELN